ncbi:hypothetical protein BN971_04162 [Mycobacterium bohemicum DSM 44277]|uniref:Uncharacterized protein n=1 Tax=Mycobacterium bohemicum DSM 44277 TaxID=1236609 RepID=A0A0U0WCT1_MYCBE|nr:hypothetical protein BN971_04162 [Mycobacterium bohemicum DSM 44277]
MGCVGHREQPVGHGQRRGVVGADQAGDLAPPSRTAPRPSMATCSCAGRSVGSAPSPETVKLAEFAASIGSFTAIVTSPPAA